MTRVVRCQDCPGLCCKAFDAIVLVPGDASRLTKFLKLSMRVFDHRYLEHETPFDLLTRIVDGRGQDGLRTFIQISRIACPFLLPTGRCRVYPARPRACRVFKPGNAYCRRLRREHGEHFPR
jgi:Fe-S-cluster containining protein